MCIRDRFFNQYIRNRFRMNLKEFSKKIGINPSTISRALNDYADISQKTKDTILQLAKKYNYKPNISAQSIGSIKTKSSFKVLIADKISDASFKIFKANNILIDKKFNLKEEQIISIISNYDGIVVRSSTKVTKKIIEKSSRLKVIARAGVGIDIVEGLIPIFFEKSFKFIRNRFRIY